jgi:hypothetical protein
MTTGERPMTATEILEHNKAYWEKLENRGDLLRIDYAILTFEFNIMLHCVRPILRWARVRRRWETKHDN